MAYSEIRAATCPDEISIMSTHLGKRCKECVLSMFHNYSLQSEGSCIATISPKPKVPVWGLLAEAAIEAALLETHPRAITEMAFGFAPWQTLSHVT